MNNYSLLFMVKLALKHWLTLVIVAVVSATLAFSYFNFVAEPKYSATGSMVVTNGTMISVNDYLMNNGKIENTDVVASINFVDTVVDTLQVSKIYQDLSDELGGKYSYTELKAKSVVERRSEDTLFVDISFTATTPEEAVKITNAYLSLAPESISDLFPKATAYAVQADSARWMYPSDMIVIILGGFLGAAIVYIIMFLIYSSNPVVRDEESFKELIDIEIIGCVPDFLASKTAEKRSTRKLRVFGGKSNG